MRVTRYGYPSNAGGRCEMRALAGTRAPALKVVESILVSYRVWR
jgi:hypothetical protein